MTQPTPYRRGYDFSDAGGAQPPGGPLDDELDDVGRTVSQILRNLALIQRDDTALRNGIVGIDALDSRVLGLISGGTFSIAGTWATDTAYPAGAFLTDDGAIYLVMEAHTSTSIVDDLAAGRIAKALQNEQGTRLRDDFVGNAVQTAFSLSQSPARPTDVEVYVDGALVLPDDYVQTGATVTFDVAPANGAKISIFSITWATAPPIQTLVDAVGDRNTEISAATDFLQDVADNGGVAYVDALAATGGDMVGLALGGKLDAAVKVLTAEMAGIADDGNEATDVTAELTALAALAALHKLPIQLGPRTYLTDGTTITFTTSVRGVEGTLIKSTATTQLQHVVIMAGDGTSLEMVEIDGNCSADPIPWNSGNYDSFTGNRGLKIDASGVTVSNVTVRNVRWAGFLVEAGAQRVTLMNCLADRCRGNFGDGFIAMGAYQAAFINCRAYDFTRIGFVADAYGVVGQYCKEIAYINCSAEYGHDASILYGGGEYNNGFWCERGGQITLDNCTSKNVTHYGYLLTTWSAATNIGQEQYALRGCVSVDSQYGFVVRGFSAVPVRAVLDGCHADIRSTTGEAGFNFDGANVLDEVHLRNCSAVLRGAIVRRCSVRLGVGVVVVDGFTETWADLNTTLRDAIDNYYGSVSHFSDAPSKAVVRGWRTYDSGGTLVGTIFKFLSAARPTLDLTIERAYVRCAFTNCLRLQTLDVIWERIGNVTVDERLHIRGGKVLDGGFAFVSYRGTTRDILFEDVVFDFSANAGYLAIYNVNSTDAWPKPFLRGCRFFKNFETASPSYAVRVNGDASVIETTGANHIVSSDCIFINTGGATTNPIFSIAASADSASKVHGRGNLKSSTLSNVAPTAGKLSAASSFENWG